MVARDVWDVEEQSDSDILSQFKNFKNFKSLKI